MRRMRIAAALLALAAAAASRLPAQVAAQELNPVEPGQAAGRGAAVALDGDWLAVGAPTASPSPPGLPASLSPGTGAPGAVPTGAVYLFERVAGRWFERQKLTLSNGSAGDLFGSAVALRNGILAVAAPGRGTVHLFAQGQESAWSQETVVRSCGGAAPGFGRSVALDAVDGSQLAVGMAGSACVFRRSAVAGAPPSRTWSLELGSPLTPATRQKDDRFGESVALSGNTLAVGAPGRNLGGRRSAGAVFLFSFTPPGEKPGVKPAWVATGRLGQPAAYDQFGVSLAMSAGSPVEVLVGADGSQHRAGAAYLFTLDEPDAVVLTAPTALPGQRFGAAVALDPVRGDRLAVGAPALPAISGAGLLPPLPAGTAYVYERGPDGWVPLPPLADPRDEPLNLFGAALAVSGTEVVAAVPVADQGGGSAGSAWQFHCENGSCTPQNELSPCDLPEGIFRATLAASGDLVAVGVVQSGPVSPPAFPVGAVYLFRRAGGYWRQEARLLSQQPDPYDGFGSAVALDGDTLAVGAPDDGGGAGAVYVFRRGNGWSDPPVRLPAAVAGLRLGRSLALDSGTLAAGAAGAVYTFTFTDTGGWGPATPLAAQFPRDQDFGAAVALRGGTLVVGAPSSAGQGAAYVFRRDEKGWALGPSLSCPVPESLIPASFACSPELGSAVSLDGGTVAVGDPGSRIVHLYSGTGFGQRVDLPVDPRFDRAGFGGFFGAAVDLRGDLLAVGAPGSGLVFPYRRVGGAWVLATPLSPNPPEPGRGSALAIGDDVLADTPPLLDSSHPVLVFVNLSALQPVKESPQ